MGINCRLRRAHSAGTLGRNRLAIEDPNFDGYYLNRKVLFLGQWLRYGGRYPDWNLRLFKHEKGRYENLGTESVPNTGDNEVHEHVILAGQVGYLKNDMIHEDYRDLFHWIERHNRYSNWDARVYYNILTGRDDSGTIGAQPIWRCSAAETISQKSLGVAAF